MESQARVEEEYTAVLTTLPIFRLALQVSQMPSNLTLTYTFVYQALLVWHRGNTLSGDIHFKSYYFCTLVFNFVQLDALIVKNFCF